MLGYDNYATSFQSLMDPVGRIQTNYNYGNSGNVGSGYGYGMNRGMGYGGMVVDPMMNQKNVDSVIAADQYRNNYYGRPIPAHKKHDNLPTILGVLGTALGTAALATALIKFRGKKPVLPPATPPTVPPTTPVPTPTPPARKNIIGRQFVKMPYNPHPVSVDPSTLKYAPITNTPPAPPAPPASKNIIGRQFVKRPYNPHPVSVDPSTLKYAPIKNTPPAGPAATAPALGVTGGYVDATAVNPHSRIVPGVTAPVSNINPNIAEIQARRAQALAVNKPTHGVTGGYVDATAINPHSRIVPGVTAPVSNINPNIAKIQAERAQALAQKQPATTVSTHSRIVPGVTTPVSNINPNIAEIQARRAQALAFNKPTHGVTGGYADATAVNTHSRIVPGVTTPVSNINPNIAKIQAERAKILAPNKAAQMANNNLLNTNPELASRGKVVYTTATPEEISTANSLGQIAIFKPLKKK